MGNDNSFYLAKSGELIRIAEDDHSIGWHRNGLFGLFWLACFRPDDFKVTLVSNDDDHSWPHYVCPVDKARKQFEGGLINLRELFRETDFDQIILGGHSVLERFREQLYDKSWGYTHMTIHESECHEMYCLLTPALIGFDYPDSVFFFDGLTRRHWREKSVYPAPSTSGLMSWASVIRRLCIEYWNVPKDALSEYDGNSLDLFRLGVPLEQQSILVGGYGVW